MHLPQMSRCLVHQLKGWFPSPGELCVRASSFLAGEAIHAGAKVYSYSACLLRSLILLCFQHADTTSAPDEHSKAKTVQQQ